MAVATPSSCGRSQDQDFGSGSRPQRLGNEIHLADLLAGEARTFNLLLVFGSLLERFRQVVHGEVGDVRADAKSFDAVGVEVLVSEKRLDDSRKTGCARALCQFE